MYVFKIKQKYILDKQAISRHFRNLQNMAHNISYFNTGILYVALMTILKLAFVNQYGLELTGICLLLPPTCCDLRHAEPLPCEDVLIT